MNSVAEPTTPAAPFRNGSIFIYGASTPLCEEGNSPHSTFLHRNSDPLPEFSDRQKRFAKNVRNASDGTGETAESLCQLRIAALENDLRRRLRRTGCQNGRLHKVHVFWMGEVFRKRLMYVVPPGKINDRQFPKTRRQENRGVRIRVFFRGFRMQFRLSQDVGAH